jgi:hypothetical protein
VATRAKSPQRLPGNLPAVAITNQEARIQILDELGTAVDEIALSVACLGEAYELLPEASGDRLEQTLFRPVQKAYGRGKRTHSSFATRSNRQQRAFDSPSAGLASQGVKVLLERAVAAAAEADHQIAELQDSLLPIEAGDAELRQGLAEVRELLGGLSVPAREFLRTLGR